jgi:hypothetical protein
VSEFGIDFAEEPTRASKREPRLTPLTPEGERLTLDEVARMLRVVGVVVRKCDGEYRVNLKGGAEATAYYTDWLDDARATGLHMASHRAK